jgi:hypothetical protein
MKEIRLLPLMMLFFLISTISHSQNTKVIKDYLGVAGPVSFDNKSYSLSWSSHPAANFYKQEYLIKGDSADKFKSMILFDLLTGNSTIKEIAAAKIEELKTAKATNPLVTYEIFDNPTTGEYMIDFILTANSASGQLEIAERNIYRYTKFTSASGQKGILLFGISTRSYGNDISQFLTNLKTGKKHLADLAAKFKMPVVKLK